MDTPLTTPTYWNNNRITSMILAGILAVVVLLDSDFAYPAWLYSADTIFRTFLLIFALVPIFIPLIDSLKKIMEMNIIRLAALGVFIVLSLLRFILFLASLDKVLISVFMFTLRNFLIQSGLCFGAYWFAVLEGKISFS